MPKFYRQNKKRIDPRYFLNETTDRDININEGFHDDDDLALQYILKFTSNGQPRPEFQPVEDAFRADNIVQYGIKDIIRMASNQKRDLKRIEQAIRILMNMQDSEDAAASVLAAINKCRKGG